MFVYFRPLDDKSASIVNLWSIGAYVLCNYLVLVAMESLVQCSEQLLSRAISFSILVSFFALWMYDSQLFLPFQSSNSHSHSGRSSNSISLVNMLEWLSLLLIVVGTEMYGHSTEPEMEPIANFAPSILPTSKNFNYDVEIIPQTISPATANHSSQQPQPTKFSIRL